jgi:hypothetical protein
MWKATKRIKQVKKPSPPLRRSQGTWARSNVDKAHASSEHLANVFSRRRRTTYTTSGDPYQFEPPINRLKRAEVQEIIKSLSPKKSSGYDLVALKILEELPIIGIKYLTQLFNALVPKGYFLAQRKVAQTILIMKPGEPPNDLTSYHQ